MFTTGQTAFAAIFAICFIVIIFFSYRKDKKLHAKNYKGVKWVGLLFIAFVIILLFIKHFLKY